MVRMTRGGRLRSMTALATGAVLVAALAACTPDGGSAPPPAAGDDGLPPLADPLPLEQLALFSGVATMDAGSNCTGTLIDTGVADGPAYILTNGHCAGDIGRPAQRTTLGIEWGGTAEFFRAADHLDRTLRVDVVELAYSTMRHTDTAVLRLDSTLGALEAQGVRPIRLADTEPAEGTAVTNIAVPVQGLDFDDWVMRRGECTLGAQHTLIEFLWLWFGVWSNDCPGVRQGSSGSPLLTLAADGGPDEVVAVINTTTWGARAGGECALNRPCEVSDGQARMTPETSYAQSVAGIGRCFDASGEFALGEHCPLPTSDVWAEDGGGSFRGGDLPDAADRVPEVSVVGAEEGTVRTAVVPIGDATACAAETTYAGVSPVPLPEAGEVWDRVGVVVPVALPETEGHFLFCAVRGEAYGQAASVLFEVDRTPSVVPVGIDTIDFGDGTVMVQPHFDPPELSRVRFIWGPPDTVDCENTDAFRDLMMVAPILTADDLPVLFCVYALDAAGNPTDVERFDIPAP